MYTKDNTLQLKIHTNRYLTADKILTP